MRKLNLIIYFAITLLFISCHFESKTQSKVEIPLNNIHVNILSWDKNLSQVDRVYYRNNIRYTGELNNKLKNSKIKTSVQLRDGLLHGSFMEVYSDGQVRTEKRYKNGYEEGEQKGCLMTFSYREFHFGRCEWSYQRHI